ncbi:MAG: hypothetical protein QOH52_3200 [Pseudonocardiales bacterium]|jgi:hypothetical protein|nr:hypothetical protein [Pseudonocardiales bacterium]
MSREVGCSHTTVSTAFSEPRLHAEEARAAGDELGLPDGHEFYLP